MEQKALEIAIKSWLCFWECIEHINIFQYASQKYERRKKKVENITTEVLKALGN